MMNTGLDDTHLCIKCSITIEGLENYIKHRKDGCSRIQQHNVTENSKNKNHHITERVDTDADDNVMSTSSRAHLDHTYDAFSYQEPEAPTTYVNKSQHGGKSTKSFTDAYELTYELGADVFFSSLQLQSVQSSGPSTSGKSASSSMQRQKQEQEGGKVGWMTHQGTQRNSERLMKAFSEIGDVKPSYEHIFKPINFAHDSTDLSEDDVDDDDEDLQVEVNDEDDDDDDEDYDSIAIVAHGSGGKWKSSPQLMRHSPPVVPASHTGGKWKPENRPHLRVTHTQISRLSPTWYEQVDEVETLGAPEVQQHPPADHTKGKWVPGTKLQRLEYKEVKIITKTPKEDYWCNICCRRLKNKINYENHLKSGYHLKRAEPEQQLEKASLAQLKSEEITEIFESQQTEIKVEETSKKSLQSSKKRFRRATYIRCDLCKHVMLRHLIGKHLISHYHYRRMHVNVGKSLRMILDNIHSIVLQSPYQCRPCHFYANTEEAFLWHWNSTTHLDASEGAGKLYCSYCHYECEDNNQMRRHLLGSDHKEVILAINRSVPISISRKLSITCLRCRQDFRYNAELRHHMKVIHPGEEVFGTASDVYQSRFKCVSCGECCRSQVSLQRHEKIKHSILKFFCSICDLQFGTPLQAKRHRKTLEHRKQASIMAHRNKKKKIQAKPLGNSMNCSKCDFVAKSEAEAVVHELSHTNSNVSNKMRIASKPKEKVSSEGKIKKRIRKQKEFEVIKCKVCSEVFPTKHDLKEHFSSEHALLTHICPCCGEGFITAQALGRHTRQCSPTNTSIVKAQFPDVDNMHAINKWTCDQCEFSSTYESELIYHRLHHTRGTLSKKDLIKCPLCTKVFRKYSLRCHLRQHTNERIFECEFCKLKFSRHHNLKDHINNQHKPAVSANMQNTIATGDSGKEMDKQCSIGIVKQQRFSCNTCDKQFGTQHTLRQHKLTRHGEGQAKFRCSHEGCNYAAIGQAALKTHMISHAQEKLKCDHPRCNYVGRSLVHLARHRRSHMSPTKLFSCDQCDFVSRTQVHMRRHMNSHRGEKSHQCPHCDFKCSSLDNLRKHILKTNKHPGKFIYECQECEMSKNEPRNDHEETEIFKTNSFKEFQNHLTSMH